jgi:hypothetical protein
MPLGGVFAFTQSSIMSSAHVNPSRWLNFESEKNDSNVETPYHDNDLILTPIISSQSG